MGWTFTEKPRDVKAHLREQLTWESDDKAHRCVDIGMTINVAYAAVETLEKATGERKIWAVVILMRYRKGDGRESWGYKEMSEDWDPVEAQCPKRILNILTPTDSDNANDWRKRCRDTLERRKHARNLKPGVMIEFKTDVTFTDGFEGRRFKVEMVPRGLRGRRQKLLRATNGCLYRVTGLGRRGDWKVIAKSSAA